MAVNDYYPIKTVGGVIVPCPSTYQYELSDVSDADSGRTEDGLMHKMRIAQKVHIQLSWSYVSFADAKTILEAFNPEYIDVNYLDPMTNTYQTKTFYVGDRSAPLYNTRKQLWTGISFNIIER